MRTYRLDRSTPMGAKTGISWTGKTWNYVRGCSEVSSGCANCYARLMAARFNGINQPYQGLAYFDETGRSRWTGKLAVVPHQLDLPIRWQKPDLVFVNSMSDLYHEDMDINAIINSYEVMETANWHIYQTLTKRAELLADTRTKITLKSGRNLYSNPLPNEWLGISVEDEKTAIERAKYLGNTPAAVRWISAEPLIGNIDWERLIIESKANWIVIGGESRQGDEKKCREMPISWIRDGINVCNKLGIPVFIKQLGYWTAKFTLRPEKFKADPSGKKPECWPEDIAVQNYPIQIKELENAQNEWTKKNKRKPVPNVIPLEILDMSILN